MFEVRLIACVSGNPLKAWRGGEPDDVWEDQTHPFGDLAEAKTFISGLHPQSTTHVKLYADDELIFDQDAGADHLPDAAPGTQMPHMLDLTPSDDVIPEAPPLLASQRGN